MVVLPFPHSHLLLDLPRFLTPVIICPISTIRHLYSFKYLLIYFLVLPTLQAFCYQPRICAPPDKYLCSESLYIKYQSREQKNWVR